MSKNDPNHEFIESPFILSRREFIAIGGIIVALLALPAVWVRSALINRNQHIQARTRGLYKDDVTSKIRLSHENPAVMKLYRDFAGKPLSPVSEELLHTKYVNRTKALA
ncbi:MAG TPA: iron hydrogenase small subunit [Syntrophales bacterium]|jgi:ferredoxin hydrogenase small subunit|nr:iron hydrogenase small subunit [Syntrophales bacterium]